MRRKKIIFVIVEGPSDETALGVLLNRFFDDSEVYVQIMRCDITSASNVTPNNIVAKIGKVVKDYAARLFKPGDFSKIIHLADMDGAFIPDDSVIEDPSAENPVYSVTEIRTQRKANIESRNQQKRGNLNRLSSVSKIWNIPYQIYYMSCNLDHVLYDKLNSTDEEKENDAYSFAKKYKEDIPGFIRFISESDFSVMGSYSQSWQYIRKELHSLERHSNLGLCFLSHGENSDNYQ